MLYSHRKAYAAMPSVWRPVHRLLWAAYQPFADFGVARFIWRQYRRVWPS